MTDTTTSSDYPQGASPQEIWAILREIAENHKRYNEEFEKRQEQWEKDREKQRIEADLEIKKLEKQIAITSNLMGDLSNRFGELAEHLVIPNIKEKSNRPAIRL